MSFWRSDSAAPAVAFEAFGSETGALLAEGEPRLTRLTLQIAAAAVVLALVLAGFAKVDRVVSAPGEIGAPQSAIVVQSLDRAIITSIKAREGDRVQAGQILATLDPTFAAADVAQIKVQIESLDAEIGRLQAEHDGREIAPGALPARYDAMQRALWRQRQAEHDERLRGFDAKIAQYEATIDKYRKNAERYGEQLQVLQELEDIRHKLYDMRDGSRLNLLEAMNRRLEIARDVDYEKSALVETEHALDSARADRETFLRQWQGQIDTTLVQRRTERDTALEQLAKASRHHDLIDLRAPTDAIVLRVARLSVGSVLAEATPLFTLVPADAPLEAEVRVDARDVGFLRPGDAVALKIVPYDYLRHGYVEGHLRVLSADSFSSLDGDDRTRVSPYYKGYVTLDRPRLHGVPADFHLVQGMPVIADLRVGRRSVLAYLLSGALRDVDESMREP